MTMNVLLVVAGSSELGPEVARPEFPPSHLPPRCPEVSSILSSRREAAKIASWWLVCDHETRDLAS